MEWSLSRGVIDESEALEMKESVRRYIAANKNSVKGFSFSSYTIIEPPSVCKVNLPYPSS